MHQWLDNVGFIGTENIIGSNRWRERFSDFETQKLFLFENRYICIPVCQQSSSGTACGPPPTISSYTSRLSASTIDSPRRVGRLQRPRRRAPLMRTTAAMGIGRYLPLSPGVGSGAVLFSVAERALIRCSFAKRFFRCLRFLRPL